MICKANSCTCCGNILWALPVLDPKSLVVLFLHLPQHITLGNFRNQCLDVEKHGVLLLRLRQVSKSASINATGLTHDNYTYSSSYVRFCFKKYSKICKKFTNLTKNQEMVVYIPCIRPLAK